MNPPSALRRLARRVVPHAIVRKVRGELLAREIAAAARKGVVPPPALWPLIGGDADFVAQGRFFFDYLVETSGLASSGAVLDVGCGLGKHAIHFARYLTADGRYEGFDVEESRIAWCRAAIQSRHPNVRFTYAPVHNAMYSPQGAQDAGDFAFPYRSGVFDLVFLASVFTHMFDRDVEGYLRQIARVLKPGGVCVATVYLLNPARRAAIAAGGTVFSFPTAYKGSWIEFADPPEAAVAHEETRLREMAAAAGLALVEPIRLGVWDRQAAQDQDFLVLRRDSRADVAA